MNNIEEKVEDVLLEKVIENYKCERCNEGELIHQKGIVLMSYPAKYVHKCNKCGFESNLASTFPRVTYREKI